MQSCINQMLNKPYRPVWWAILPILGMSVVGGNSAIDIQLHDTYLVIESFYVGILLSIILAIIGCVYWLLRNKMLVGWMTAFHVVATILSFTLLAISNLASKMGMEADVDVFRTVNQILVAILLVALLSQLLFVINGLSGLFRSNGSRF